MTDALFALPHTAYRAKPGKRPDLDVGALSRLAFCYTASELGNCSGIRFAMTVEDAVTWCSSDLSRGRTYDTDWVYMWTRVTTFLEVFPPPLDINGYVDDGTWDDRIASTGAVKIGFESFRDVFGPLGLAIVGNT